MKKKNFLKGLATLATAGLVAFAVATPVQAEEDSAMARGGKLYDKWYKVIGVDAPKKSHPSYPADKKYAKKAAIDTDNDANYLSAKERIESTSENDGTWILSDHRIIWMQINIW